MTALNTLATEDLPSHICRLERLREAEQHDYQAPEEPTLPKLSEGSYAIHNAMNCSGLFSTSQDKVRTHLRAVFQATNGFSVTYAGPRLYQDDKAVLLELIHRRRGKYAGEIVFAPSTFCKSLGWSDSKHNIERLRESLDQLVEATLKIERDPANGSKFNFMRFSYRDDRWVVTLTEDVVRLYPTGLKNVSFLDIEERKQLTPGMQTWLYDYIRSNDCRIVLTYANLREACGRGDQEPKTVVEYFKAALKKLQTLGIIRGYKFAKNAQGQPGIWVDKK